MMRGYTKHLNHFTTSLINSIKPEYKCKILFMKRIIFTFFTLFALKPNSIFLSLVNTTLSKTSLQNTRMYLGNLHIYSTSGNIILIIGHYNTLRCNQQVWANSADLDQTATSPFYDIYIYTYSKVCKSVPLLHSLLFPVPWVRNSPVHILLPGCSPHTRCCSPRGLPYFCQAHSGLHNHLENWRFSLTVIIKTINNVLIMAIFMKTGHFHTTDAC